MNQRSISTFRRLRPNASRFQSDLPTERSCKKRSTVFNDPCEAERRIRNSPSDGEKAPSKGEEAGVRYTSYAVRVLLCPFRHGVWLITLPAGGVCLAHRPLSLKTCGQKVKTPLILHKISGVFFAPAQLGGKACAARGRSSALVRAIARATLTRGVQQTILPQFCTTKSENRDFSC